jgi:arylsulfatase A-like enzyme
VKQPVEVDGRSLVPLLKQAGSFQRDALYWHYPHYWGGGRVRPFGAIRSGPWKLIEFYEDQRLELYNLANDLSESRDLATSNRAKAAELREMLHRWRSSVGAQMPTPNPDYHVRQPPAERESGVAQACWLRMAEE